MPSLPLVGKMLRAAQLVAAAAIPVVRPWESDGDALALLTSSHGGAWHATNAPSPCTYIDFHRFPVG